MKQFLIFQTKKSWYLESALIFFFIYLLFHNTKNILLVHVKLLYLDKCRYTAFYSLYLLTYYHTRSIILLLKKVIWNRYCINKNIMQILYLLCNYLIVERVVFKTERRRGIFFRYSLFLQMFVKYLGLNCLQISNATIMPMWYDVKIAQAFCTTDV